MNKIGSAFSFAGLLRGWPQGLLAALGGIIALGAPAAPQEANIDGSPVSDTPASVAIDRLRLSDMLADFGERSTDPIALVEAAKIRKMLPPPLNAPAESESRSWEELLARAAQLAGPDPTVAGLADDVRRLRTRDIPLIPDAIKFLHKKIKEQAADRAEVRFLAGELAVVYIHPVPGVELEMFVYDDLNNLICTGGAGSQGTECRWRPRRNGSYLIDVRNHSAVPADYDIAINREPVPR